MDLQRLFLFLIFAFSTVLVWDGWQQYQHPEKYALQPVTTIEGQKKSNGVVPAFATALTQSQRKSVSESKIIHVKTDIYDVEISTVGGDISRLALLHHPDSADQNKPFILFENGSGTHNYTAQSGLLGDGLPNHNTVFTADQSNYELNSQADSVQVRMVAEQNSALSVVKVITFRRNDYVIDITYELTNNGTQSVTTNSYFQLVRDDVPPAGSSMFLPTYTGAAVYTEANKFQKVAFTDIAKSKQDYPKESNDGWIGMLQHYFVAAWLPNENAKREYFTRKLDGNMYSAGVVLGETTIQPGQSTKINSRLYAGPAKSELDAITPGLGLTVDYGWVTVIAAPLFWVMSFFHDWTGNWGIAIILLTVLIKLLFFPLSAASYRSMAKMRLVAPKLEKIKEQYGHDREQLNRSMMELYKTEKINPLGGCLPVMIQIPVFIALFWAILSSVEMRYAPFFGWITDLSVADPYFILPVLMGLSMIIQTRLNPTPLDPMQAKVMQIMPIAFSVVFFFFPAGLVLYSIVNNLLSIAQQWYITRISAEENKVVVAKR